MRRYIITILFVAVMAFITIVIIFIKISGLDSLPWVGSSLVGRVTAVFF